ncbi:hypothetical protein D3C84_479180 [compost metagenome]
MAGDKAAPSISVQTLQIEAGSVVFGLVDIGEKAGIIDDCPVDRCAVLQGVAYLSTAHAEDHSRVQQEVERRTGDHTAVSLPVPVAEQTGFTSGEQVVAPALVMVAPVVRLVDQLLSAGGGLAIYDQSHFDLINATRQRTRIQRL